MTLTQHLLLHGMFHTLCFGWPSSSQALLPATCTPPYWLSPFWFHVTYILLAFPASLELPPIMATFLPLWPIPSRIHVYNLTLGSIQGRERVLSFHVWATSINILISWPIRYPENFLFLYSQIKCLYLHHTSCPFTGSWISMQTPPPGGYEQRNNGY